MSPIQQMLLGVSPDSTKYVDEVFKINTFIGTGSNKSITNNINLSSKGGMVWVKNRDQNYNHWLFTSSMGIGNAMRTNNANDKWGFGSAGMVSFNSDGYTVGTHQGVNNSGDDMVGWTFRNSKAFQQLTYEGTGSAQNISHSLKSIPGMIIVKNIDSSSTNWSVYHRELGTGKFILLNSTAGASTTNVADYWNNTAATATQFTVGGGNDVNKDGDTYIAYLFAGGESDAATARSVDFDGTDDYLSWAATSDFAFGTGAYTVEFWIKPDTLSAGANFFNVATDNGFVVVVGDSKVAINQYSVGDKVATSTAPSIGQWTHYALVREGTGSNDTKIYENGILVKTGTDATNWSTTHTAGLGANAANSTQEYDGKISNFRIVKGTAVYTTDFKPPTEPLTNITNTVVLCCNNSSVTGSTVTPGTISSNGDPTASTDSPFDDPDGFAFGEDEDQQIVATGSYNGNGNATGPDVYLGWEPQYVMIKRHDSAENWNIYDSMRGIVSDGNDEELRPESSALEYSYSRIDLTSTGFKPMTNNQYTNQDGGEYIYLAFRRSDGYVGKPAEAGTDVFAMDTGNASSTIPTFDSTFPVDFGIMRSPGVDDNNNTGARLTGTGGMRTNGNNSETDYGSQWAWDSNAGWVANSNYQSATQSWMWKRHKGMDAVCFRGNSANRQIAHGLNSVPEMIIVKQRTSSTNWEVYHKGLNGGGNPEQYRIALTDSAEVDDNTAWNDTAPTATHFSLGTNANVNNNAEDLIAILFSSVSGISKVGVYAGSNSAQSITTGFQPRFVIIKNTANTDDWYVLDTVRGWASGDDKRLFLNNDSAQSNQDVGAPTSTGFDLTANVRAFNQAGRYYIYYAHA